MLSATFYQPTATGVQECAWAAVLGGKFTISSLHSSLATDLRAASSGLTAEQAEGFLRSLENQYASTYLWAKVSEG